MKCVRDNKNLSNIAKSSSTFFGERGVGKVVVCLGRFRIRQELCKPFPLS